MIGSMAEALVISRWYAYADRHADVPEGWKFLSWGTYRDVYLSPSGVIYKIDHYEYSDHEANLCEARAITNGRQIPEYGPWMPEAHLYYTEDLDAPVLAMEYIEGECELTEQEYQQAKQVSTAVSGIYDLDRAGKQDNVRRRPDGHPVLIDLGGYGSTQAMQPVA